MSLGTRLQKFEYSNSKKEGPQALYKPLVLLTYISKIRNRYFSESMPRYS